MIEMKRRQFMAMLGVRLSHLPGRSRRERHRLTFVQTKACFEVSKSDSRMTAAARCNRQRLV
jgi:hypothetical protein